jgi:hypothetical protein
VIQSSSRWSRSTEEVTGVKRSASVGADIAERVEIANLSDETDEVANIEGA